MHFTTPTSSFTMRSHRPATIRFGRTNCAASPSRRRPTDVRSLFSRHGWRRHNQNMAEVVDAILTNDPAAAAERMRRHLSMRSGGIADFLHSVRNSDHVDLFAD